MEFFPSLHSWEKFSNPTEPLFLPLDPLSLLRFDLEADFVGQLNFRVSPYARELNGEISLNEDQELNVVIDVRKFDLGR